MLLFRSSRYFHVVCVVAGAAARPALTRHRRILRRLLTTTRSTTKLHHTHTHAATYYLLYLLHRFPRLPDQIGTAINYFFLRKLFTEKEFNHCTNMAWLTQSKNCFMVTCLFRRLVSITKDISRRALNMNEIM